MPFYAPRLKSVLTSLVLAVFTVVLQSTGFAAAPTPLITSSVKLRVDGANGHDWGTGTIIDVRQSSNSPTGQEALILTCGHIFRASQGQGNVEVHLYGENSTVRVYGRCLDYDDSELDLALVAIAPPGPVRAVAIAPEGYRIQPGQQTWSVGCDSGGNPTVQTHQIMSVDRISRPGMRVPFHYVQVSGAPVGGRSGGGLFSAEGYLIGVCNTGDPTVNDGHFVPPQMIRHILEQTLPAYVYQELLLGEPLRATPLPMASTAPTTSIVPTTSIALAPLTQIESLPNVPPMAMPAVPAPMFAANQNFGGISREEQATLEEIERRKQDGAEVIVIIRSPRNPEIPSDVIVMNGASDRFLDALVNSPTQPSNPAYNPVIFSSQSPARTAGPQPVSFPVRH